MKTSSWIFSGRPAPVRRASRYFVGFLLSLSGVGAWADVIPFGVTDAQERFAKHKDVHDRVDQFCQGKAIGAACAIPGTAFEGGGKGVCQRDLPEKATQIDLRCTLATPVAIERRIPKGAFRSDPSDCKGTAKLSPDQPLDCIDPPPVSDRFCAGHKENDSCTAALQVAAKEHSEAGRCAMTVEKTSYYHYGNRVGTRRVLQCMPQHPAPAAEFKSVSLKEKLWPQRR